MKIKYQAEGLGTFISTEVDADEIAYEHVRTLARIMRALEFSEYTIVNAMYRYADENTPAEPGKISFDFEENN